jgi:hypothetical protein
MVEPKDRYIAADGDGRALDLRTLADAHAANGLETGDEDPQIDHDGEDRPADEDVGEPHGATSPVHRVRRQLGVELHLAAERDARAIPELERPRHDDLLAGLDPRGDGDEIPARLHQADELLRTHFDGLPSAP